MNMPSLSRLYRRLTSPAPAQAVDAEALLAALGRRPAEAGKRGQAVDAIAGSAAHADLARMLNALHGESEVLAVQVRRAQLGVAAHARRGSERRHGHGMRMRWVASVAACAALAIGVFALHERSTLRGDPGSMVAASQHSAAPGRVTSGGDRIFTSGLDGSTHATGALPDELFRSDFSEHGS